MKGRRRPFGTRRRPAVPDSSARAHSRMQIAVCGAVRELGEREIADRPHHRVDVAGGQLLPWELFDHPASRAGTWRRSRPADGARRGGPHRQSGSAAPPRRDAARWQTPADPTSSPAPPRLRATEATRSLGSTPPKCIEQLRFSQSTPCRPDAAHRVAHQTRSITFVVVLVTLQHEREEIGQQWRRQVVSDHFADGEVIAVLAKLVEHGAQVQRVGGGRRREQCRRCGSRRAPLRTGRGTRLIRARRSVSSSGGISSTGQPRWSAASTGREPVVVSSTHTPGGTTVGSQVRSGAPSMSTRRSAPSTSTTLRRPLAVARPSAANRAPRARRCIGGRRRWVAEVVGTVQLRSQPVCHLQPLSGVVGGADMVANHDVVGMFVAPSIEPRHGDLGGSRTCNAGQHQRCRSTAGPLVEPCLQRRPTHRATHLRGGVRLVRSRLAGQCVRNVGQRVQAIDEGHEIGMYSLAQPTNVAVVVGRCSAGVDPQS